MKKITLFLLLIISSSLTFSQTPAWVWAKVMNGSGNEVGKSVASDAFGNVYTTGYFMGTVDFDPGTAVFNLTGGWDIFVSKLSPTGNFVWARAFAGTIIGVGRSIAVDASGNVYITGYFQGTVDFNPGVGVYNLTSSGAWDIFICKLDVAGNFVWAQAIGGGGYDDSYSIYIDAAGNVLTTGEFYGTVDFDPGVGAYNMSVVGDYDIFILKLSPSGNFVWAKRLGGIGYDGGASLTIDAFGNVYTTGAFQDTADFDPGIGTYNLISASSDTTDIFISKLDASGNFVWAKAIGGAGNDRGNSIALDTSGNIYIGGRFEGTADFDPDTSVYNLTSAGGWDIFVSKLSPSGNFVWSKAMAGISDNQCNSIAVDAFENVYAAGEFYGTVDFDPGPGVYNLISSGTWDIFISKLDALGNFVWTATAGGTSDDREPSLALNSTTISNVYVTGYFYSPLISFGSTTITHSASNSMDIFVAKLDTSTTMTEIENIERKNEILVYPNPTISELTIDNRELKIEKIELYNTVGKIVFSSHLSSFTTHHSIDVSQLPPGIYFITLTDIAGNKVTKKVVKM